MRSVKAFLLLLTSTLCLAQSPVDRLTAPIESGLTVPLKGNLHGGARPEFDQGRVDGSMAMQAVSLVFKPSPAQQSALDQLLAQQQDRMSPNYHKWLTPAQFGDRFGMSKSDLDKVVSWLQSQGFTVTRIANSRNEVFFRGTAAQVESAFHTELHHYLVNGEMHFANATEPSVPAALSGVALAIRNLHNFEPKPRARVRKVPASEVSPHFTSSISGSHFLAPDDFATIYHVQGLYGAGIDGTGQKIAVIGQSAINLADVQNFRKAAFPLLPHKDPTLLLVPSSGNSTTCPGDEGESDLDVEWSGGVAKNASIILVYEGVPSGQTCSNRTNGAFDALDYTVNAVPQIAPIISISYGLCENTNSAVGITQAQALSLRTLAQQANTQGQTITSASGDNGAADCEDPQTTSAVRGLAVDIPAAIPEVTGVGGNEFTGDSATCPSTGCPSNTAPADPPYWSGSGVGTDTISSALEYIPEMAWNDTLDTTDNPQGFLSASGGGASIYFAKPTWQTGTGVPNDAKRDVPDIAVNASPFHDAYLFCSEDGQNGTKVSTCTSGFRDSSQALSVVGGTSAGAPTFAAILALVDQSLIASGFESAPGLGNVNPTLYQLAGSNPTSFNDVTSGSNNIVPCTKATPNCPASGQFGFSTGTGYDQVTGLGSVSANTLAAAWAGTPNFTLQPSAATFSVVAGNSAQVTVTVHPLNGFNAALTFTCSDPASESTCVPPSGATTQSSVTFNLTTTAPTARLGSPFSRRGSVFYALLVPGLLGVLMAAGQRKPTARGMRLLGLIVALGFSTLWLAACGGSSSNKNPGTTKGTYTVKLTATSGGANPISNSTQVTLIVQ
jgi:subtilase family serine protease